MLVTIMQSPISKIKAIEVTLHGHAWKVYPMKCRNKTLYRVVHRVNGERRPKNFSSLADAKADARTPDIRVNKNGIVSSHDASRIA